MAYLYKRGKFYWVGYIEGGKPVQKSLRVKNKGVKNREAANTLLGEYQLIEAKHRHRSRALVVNKSIEAVFDEYIENRGGRQRTKDWYEWCKECFRIYCEEEGIKYIGDVTIGAVEKFYSGRKKGDYIEVEEGKERKKTPGAARSNLRALRAVFGYAVKKGYIHDNPALEVRPDKPTRKIFRDLTFEETAALLNTAESYAPEFYPIYATAYYAGLRLGELVYLEARDINYDKKGYVYVRNKPENLIKDKQERKIPLNVKLRGVLKKLRPRSRWIFTTKDGAPRKNNLNRKLRTIGKLAKIDTKGLSMQVLRETFGSHLRRRGVDMALISEYLGHSSIDVTMRHYAHIPIEDTHEEIDLL